MFAANKASAAAASAAVIHLTGIEPIVNVIRNFYGVEHRMEFVREKDSTA